MYRKKLMKNNWQKIAKTILAYISVVAGLLIIYCLLIYINNNLHIDIAKEILEYLKVIFSWPIIVFTLSMIFMFKFSKEIHDFLLNTTHFKAGPVEMTKQSEEEPPSEKIEGNLENDNNVQFTQDQITALDNEFTRLSSETDQQKQTIEQKDEFIRYLIARLELTEFAYLNLFFVPNTKMVLHWLRSVGQTTKELFNISFQPSIPSEVERETIFSVLLGNEMIIEQNSQFQLTEKANKFLDYLGKN